jgi:hypothetical protein
MPKCAFNARRSFWSAQIIFLSLERPRQCLTFHVLTMPYALSTVRFATGGIIRQTGPGESALACLLVGHEHAAVAVAKSGHPAGAARGQIPMRAQRGASLPSRHVSSTRGDTTGCLHGVEAVIDKDRQRRLRAPRRGHRARRDARPPGPRLTRGGSGPGHRGQHPAHIHQVVLALVHRAPGDPGQVALGGLRPRVEQPPRAACLVKGLERHGAQLGGSRRADLRRPGRGRSMDVTVDHGHELVDVERLGEKLGGADREELIAGPC